MAPAEVAAAMQPVYGDANDVQRAREFYRYLQPENLVLSQLARRSSAIEAFNGITPSLSAALAPFCQLTALRMNARKAMLNVMDRDVMYFLAEASRIPTANGEQERFEFVEDPIMMACSSTPLNGRVCEMTLKLSKDERVPMFTIPDLLQSEFAELGPVAGPPYYRFYAGTPITSPNGINIGSLAVMDTEPRDGLSQSEVDFLGTTASQIMTYLEINRQAIEGRRARSLAEGLEAFVAGKETLQDDGADDILRKSSARRKRKAYGFGMPSAPGRNRFQPPAIAPGPKAMQSLESIDYDTGTSEMTSDNDQGKAKDIDLEARSHSKTFARAANLLRESFGDLGEDGIVVFMTVKGRLDNPVNSSSAGHHRHRSSESASSLPTINGDSTRAGATPQALILKEAGVLASSSLATPLMTAEDANIGRVNLSEDMLREFMRRYPGGKLFSLDDPNRSSSEDDSTKSMTSAFSEASRPRTRRKKTELKAVSAAFPHARQVLFAPVWDSSVGAFQQAVFVAASSDTRSLSPTTELSFLNSFCSTVMAECSRIDTMKADKQKSDFVGTISHEMRSPLHGILASVEFLAETELTDFQESLVNTIDSCGRTLLDTINHVLDFSKVNSFQKHWQASNRRTNYLSKRKHYLGPESQSKAYAHGAPPLLQLFAVTDISAVLEEVVDGLVLGQTFNSGIDIMDMSRSARGRGSKSSENSDIPQEDVQVVLDVQQADWAFLTQPGAVRRIVLNLTGNALKYTSQGTITVCLSQKPGDSEGTKIMVLRVTDTGKGISQEFLSTKLFVPFAQENALAPGTGLGLSIVHSIVTMLGGTIDVKSQVGKGTTIEVALPLQRPLPGQMSTANTPHSGGTSSSTGSRPDESLTLLQTQASDSRVAYYRPQRSLANDKLNEILSRYVKDWYGLNLVDPLLIGSADLVIAEEEDLEDLMQVLVGTPGTRPALIVLCSVASRHSSTYISSLESRINGAVAFVSKPVGPYKLAKSMRLALQNLRAIKPQSRNVVQLGAIKEQATPGLTPMNSADHNMESATENLAEMNLSPQTNDPNQMVQASETVAVSQTSRNAQMAIASPSNKAKTPAARAVEENAFPFPDQKTEQETNAEDTPGERTAQQQADADATSAQGRRTASVSIQVNGMPTVDPRILLVDDNKINLRLLQTFLKKKRKYTRIDLAEDGQQAVDVFTTHSSLGDGYEIVFMDISMPVMNGFEATRAIREYEEQSPRCVGKGTMVIALTGLASGKDQAEGFDAGVDIYLTKPVSFKEVGKLLDNWEAHQRLKGDAKEVPAELRAGAALENGPTMRLAVKD